MRFLLLFLLVLPIVLAEDSVEDYNDYSQLELKLDVHTDMSINLLQKDSRIESLIANLMLYPRDYPIEVHSTPQALTKVEEEKISFSWDNPSTGSLGLRVESVFISKNDFTKIPGKVDFPIVQLDDELYPYLRETEYINIDDAIAARAAELVEGETDLHVAVTKIAEWVRTNIKYDLNTLTAEVVQKSSWVMAKREGVCDEITNLFISMLRSVGIPARFVTGVVYTNIGYEFGNHGWAEVYFPGYGWVPFDVTLGQYGWVDPSHVRLAAKADSGEPSLSYMWKARNTDVVAAQLEIDTKVISAKKGMSPLVELEIEPLEKEVGFESYVPVRVGVKNLMPYYIPSIIKMRKAPGLMGEASRHDILKPFEEKDYYWTAYAQNKLEKRFIYTYELEAVSLFGAASNSTIRFGENFDVYTQEEAESVINMLSEQKKKSLSPRLSLACSTEQDEYYINEDIMVECEIKNIGNTNLRDVAVCLNTRCKTLNLLILESAKVSFSLPAAKEELAVSAKTLGISEQVALNVNVAERPNIQIELKTEEADYAKDSELEMMLLTNSKAYEVTMDIEGFRTMHFKTLPGDYGISFNFKGKDFKDGLVRIKLAYKDKNGRLYEETKEFKILIKNVPFYARISSILKDGIRKFWQG